MSALVKVVNTNKIVRAVKDSNIVRVISRSSIIQSMGLQDFAFIAIEGQRVFTLTTAYKVNGMVVVYINGTGQSKANGDFIISGYTLTLDEAVDAGDIVAGFYEVNR
jgi:hypothetical protein